ncbi:hypothetical protein K2173_019568 [Erythroxylum novogranatense]|uniref:Uncharacterized protein n=1 Tax=Erythroxylum novogranatense TaxID=1862640 RepID=A0AAV8UBK9_9ROSI|nr:hypothetical protein K2173_019568 [Erythroxylum novogranatense]
MHRHRHIIALRHTTARARTQAHTLSVSHALACESDLSRDQASVCLAFWWLWCLVAEKVEENVGMGEVSGFDTVLSFGEKDDNAAARRHYQYFLSKWGPVQIRMA